jgi:hypothetical protein
MAMGRMRLGEPLPLAAALMLFGIVVALTPLRDLDLEVYLAAAQQVFVHGTEPYTRPEGTGLPFTYPPTALFMLRPLAVLNLEQAANLLWALNLALAALVIWLLPRDLAHVPVGEASPPRSEPYHEDRGQRPLPVRPRGRLISTVKVRVGVSRSSVANGNCVAARRGGTQPEANCRAAG